MKLFRIAFFTALLSVTLAFSAFAAAPTMCSKKVDSFDFVVDYSGSMMMTNSKMKEIKMDLAKVVLTRINSIIPDLDYHGGMHTLAPAATMINQGLWNRSEMGAAINKLNSNLPIFGRLTPMGTGLKTYEPWISSMRRDAALILVTDGDNNRGLNLVEVVKGIYASQRDLIVHVISFADSKNGKEVIQQIAALNPQTIVADGVNLATNDAVLQKFVLDVWCEEGEDVIVLRGVNFAFNSDKLDSKAVAILTEAANIIKANPNKAIILNGWTDSIGSENYNMGLSKRRASAVKNFFASQGVPASRIEAIGRGKSYKYNNATEEGRYMNRRVEIMFE